MKTPDEDFKRRVSVLEHVELEAERSILYSCLVGRKDAEDDLALLDWRFNRAKAILEEIREQAKTGEGTPEHDEAHKAARELKTCGLDKKENPNAETCIQIICDADIPLLGRQTLLRVAGLDDDKIKEILVCDTLPWEGEE